MVTHLLDVMVPAPVATPQGARAAAAVALWLGAMGQALWLGAQRYGNRRAAGHLRRLASERQISNPPLAAQLRESAAWLSAELKAEFKAGSKTEARS